MWITQVQLPFKEYQVLFGIPYTKVMAGWTISSH